MLVCECGNKRLNVSWQTFKNGTKHLRAYCRTCESISFLKKTPENMLLVESYAEDDAESQVADSSLIVASLLMIFPHEMSADEIVIKRVPGREGNVGGQLVTELDKLLGLETD